MAKRPIRLATILCGECVREGGRRRPVIGEVWKYLDGRIYWHALDARHARARRSRNILTTKARDRVPLAIPEGASDLPPHLLRGLRSVPETLRAFCRYHGPGRVASSDITKARGSVAVKFTATT